MYGPFIWGVNVIDNFIESEEIWKKRSEVVQGYEQYRYDLEDVHETLNTYKIDYIIWCKKKSESEDDYSRKMNEWLEDKNNEFDYILCLDQIRTSFLGPAYNFNRLIDVIIQDVYWDDIKYEIPVEDWVSMGNRTSAIVLDMHNCLISIKTALDRLVKLFRLYKKGISDYCTFGHIGKNNKSKGLMSRIIQDRDKDDISEYVYQEYNRWIYKCVKPRDTIIHYDDIQVVYSFADFCELPSFIYSMNENNNNSSRSNEIATTYKLSFVDVYSYVQSFYDFANTIIEMIYKRLTSDNNMTP